MGMGSESREKMEKWCEDKVIHVWRDKLGKKWESVGGVVGSYIVSWVVFTRLTSFPTSPFFIHFPFHNTMTDHFCAFFHSRDPAQSPTQKPCQFMLFGKTNIVDESVLACSHAVVGSSLG